MSFSFKNVRLSRSTWLSLLVTLGLVAAIGFTQYASLNTRDTRTSAQSGALWVRSTPATGFTIIDQTGAGYSGVTDYLYGVGNFQTIVLRAQPRNGYNFANWTGCDSVVGADCGINLNPGFGRTVIANYSTANNSLFVWSMGASSGNVSISGSQPGTGGTTSTFSSGSVYYYQILTSAQIGTTLTAPVTAPSGETFSHWTGNCDSINNTARTCVASVINGGSEGVIANYTAPSPPPTASADLKVNGSDSSVTITSGSSATLSWSSTNAVSCTASGSGWAGTRPTSGSESTGALTSSRTYSMACTNSVGQGSNMDTVTVNVSTPSQVSADIKANNSDGPITIGYNSPATISWTSSNATSCSVSPGGWSGTSGSQASGNITASTTFNLNCSGSGGSKTDAVTVNVSAAPLPNLAVSNFNLSPATPTPGQTVTATINVINTGNNSASGTFWVDLYSNQGNSAACGVNGQASKSFSSLGAGISTGNFTLTFKAPSAAGNYTARVFADSDCQIAESDDGNNQSVKAYTVSTTGGGSGSGSGSSAPKVGTGTPTAGSSDIALTFAENPFLKGGMEITMQVDGTSISQKAVVENKGGSFVLKTNNVLSKSKAYVLKIYSRNSLVQSINFTFADNTKTNVAAFTMGDFDRNNVVAEEDRAALETNGSGNQDLLYDVNYDGVVNSVDYSIVVGNLGKKG